MKKFPSSDLFQLIGGACQIYLGMSFLGLVEGFINTGSLTSRIIGALLLCGGLASLWIALRTPAPRIETLPLPSQEILALAASGEMIAAIKNYRKQTGASLKDAKQIIESNFTSVPRA